MKQCLLWALIAFYSIGCFAQNSSRSSGNLSRQPEDIKAAASFNLKPPLDTSTFFNWPQIEKGATAISNNGKYVLYYIRNLPIGSNTLVIRALNTSREIRLFGIQRAVFSDDSRRVIFMHSSDSLCLLTISTGDKEYIPQVKSFQLFVRSGLEWLICLMNNAEKKLVLRQLGTEQMRIFENVASYTLSEDGMNMVIQTIPDSENEGTISLQYINLSDNIIKEIWRGINVESILLSSRSNQLFFLGQEGKMKDKAIWLYKPYMPNAVQLAIDQSANIMANMDLSRLTGFSKDGDKLFIQLKYKKRQMAKSSVNIWSYSDAKLQSQQLRELKDLSWKSFFGVAYIRDTIRVRRLQLDNESIVLPTAFRTEEFFLFEYSEGESSEAYWNKKAEADTWLITIANGDRKKIPLNKATFSPSGKYVIGYGSKEIDLDYFVHEVATGKTKNVTANIPIPRYDEENDFPGKSRGLQLAGWMYGDTGILIYDKYDIWQIDPLGKKAPIQLTNGRNKKLQFRLVIDYWSEGKIVPAEKNLLLKAFNTKTKQSGFYQLNPRTSIGPELLLMGDYVFNVLMDKKGFPLKARDADVQLVTRENCGQSPNIFNTTDFINFTSVSEVCPEGLVNWFTSELIQFSTQDGIQTQAILYKPENFDSFKKYPLIIHYYDKKSDEINLFQPVGTIGGALDVAWFASHGYLVLLTDIHFKIGETGESVRKAVEGAARYVSQRKYVDINRIGIQGHSFGGYETNYLVTHSNFFAAAVSSSGMSDLTSDYGNLWGSEKSRQEYYETRGGRLGKTPWEKPDIYMKNSPIYYVGNISTPILMVNNRTDRNVSFEQGLEFFTALRRAGKRAWMLEYDNGGHGVGGNDYKDYLLRMTQFFDHYLKGKPSPKWMVHGIPAIMKGITDGFELENGISTPSHGLLIIKNVKPIK